MAVLCNVCTLLPVCQTGECDRCKLAYCASCKEPKGGVAYANDKWLCGDCVTESLKLSADCAACRFTGDDSISTCGLCHTNFHAACVGLSDPSTAWSCPVNGGCTASKKCALRRATQARNVGMYAGVGTSDFELDGRVESGPMSKANNGHLDHALRELVKAGGGYIRDDPRGGSSFMCLFPPAGETKNTELTDGRQAVLRKEARRMGTPVKKLQHILNAKFHTTLTTAIQVAFCIEDFMVSDGVKVLHQGQAASLMITMGRGSEVFWWFGVAPTLKRLKAPAVKKQKLAQIPEASGSGAQSGVDLQHLMMELAKASATESKARADEKEAAAIMNKARALKLQAEAVDLLTVATNKAIAGRKELKVRDQKYNYCNVLRMLIGLEWIVVC
jgi:hypothetical protein